ncbi:MAG: polymer-forming cytoskeletal protein [Zoogloeaceae bacterium]|jgi:cytoskeletal protein CcmA (bactofilin family)|nr:polymer-forming cytoskeletal protein [Zoogloeaceae bacterium]
MFSKKHTPPTTCKTDSLIGKGTRIEGNVYFSGGLRVDGEICGQVIAESTPATLMLSEHGHIHGQVNVSHLIVNGHINGPVRAAEFLEMQPKARITGDVEYAMIEIQQGAVIEGKMLLTANAAASHDDTASVTSSAARDYNTFSRPQEDTAPLESSAA